MAHIRYLCTSYNQDAIVRDNRKMRMLVMSDWYRLLWPHVKLKRWSQHDFENTEGGSRLGATFSALTGLRGDRLIIDDPHSTKTAESEVQRLETIRLFREGALDRLNDLERSAIIIIMQRLHEEDITGLIIDQMPEQGFVHLMIPMRFEVDRRCTTKIGWTDPRSYEGELMEPQRFSDRAVNKMEEGKGPYAWAAQYMQRPVPREGGMMKVDMMLVVDSVPGIPRQRVRGWDIAGSERKTSAYTAGVRMCECGGVVYVENVVRARAEIDKAEKLIIDTAKDDSMAVMQSLPQDPGQSGKPIWDQHLILMGNGSRKKLADIVIGDSVIGIDGKDHLVSAVFDQGELPTIRIRTRSERVVYAAADHPFLTPTGWINAGDLEVGHGLGLRSRPQTTSTSTRSDMEFRLAGYFIGDGSVGRSVANQPTSSCDTGFTCADPDTLSDFTASVEAIGGQVVSRKRDVAYGAKGIQQWLRETDIAGYTSYTKRVPAWVFEGTPEQIAHFLGAYFSCDGFIPKKADEIIFYSVSRPLLEDVQHLLLRLGIASTLKTKNGIYLKTRHVSHLLRMSQKDSGAFRFMMKVPVFNRFKRERIAEHSKRMIFLRFDEDHIADPISEIEDGGLRNCRCLQVDDAESFLVEDFVVHNSQKHQLAMRLSPGNFKFSPESGSKEDRAIPFASMVNAGLVRLVRGPWNNAYIEELRSFPSGRFKDQVDASSRAYAEIVVPRASDEGIGAPMVFGLDE